MGKDLTQEGNIAALVSHQHVDWSTNTTNYKFDLPGRDSISWRAAKNADGTLSVWVHGPFDSGYDFRVPMPRVTDGQLNIGVSWANGAVKLYLTGKLVQTRDRL